MGTAWKSVWAGILMSGFLATCLQVQAEELIAGQYSFSDELGGFRLKSVKGLGSREHPFVIVQELKEFAPAVLTIRRIKLPSGNKLRKLVPVPEMGMQISIHSLTINKTRKVWVGFDLELQEILHTPSTHGDGLSFDQVEKDPKDISADHFSLIDRLFEPYDRIHFFNGVVNPDATARFSVHITDVTPTNKFYLVQEPLFLTARAPVSVWRFAKR